MNLLVRVCIDPLLKPENGVGTVPAGQQELLISPGVAFVVDGAQLTTATESPSAAVTTAATGTWGPARREIRAPASPTSRVLVIPESVNPGWVARTSSGVRLTPVTVNGWQQGWVVPAGDPGNITLTFASNSVYRVGLALGLALLPLLAVLGLRARDLVGFTFLQFMFHLPVVLALVWLLGMTFDFAPPVVPR